MGSTRSDWISLARAIGFWGILGPVASLLVLRQTTVSTTSVLLNMIWDADGGAGLDGFLGKR